MQGSTPERHISFLPLRNDVIALAVSTDDLAAARLMKMGPPVKTRIPTAPVWLSIPGSEMRQPGALPAGIRVVFSACQCGSRRAYAQRKGGQSGKFVPHAGGRAYSRQPVRSATGMIKETHSLANWHTSLRLERSTSPDFGSLENGRSAKPCSIVSPAEFECRAG